MLSPIVAHVAAALCGGKILGTFVRAARRREATLQKREKTEVTWRKVDPC